MKIDCNKLDGVEKNKILSHMMLADENIARLVAETLTKENREVDVKVLFNGVECDGDVLEKVLQFQWKAYKDSVDEKYADIEKLVQQRALKITNDFISEKRGEGLKKLEDIQERLNKVEVELWCIDVYTDDLEDK